jgi:lipid II:glycine glycyltransferase (peptidoglycan interpeptide bridge formation enzyme)
MPNNLFTFRVKYGKETVATGLFIHDNHAVSSCGMTSRTKYLHLCPNELLTWTVMTRAGKLGLRQFIIGHNYRQPEGVVQFKKKFNCKQVSIYRYSKTYSTIAKVGHRLFKVMYTLKWETKKFISKIPSNKNDSK